MRWESIFAIGATLLIFAGLPGCQNQSSVREAELQTFDELLEVGLGYAENPYVRAESLRLLEVLGDEGLADQAQSRVKDDDPMVRVAALRTLLSVDHQQARRLTMLRFNQGTTAEKRAILEAVLEYGNEELQTKVLWKAIRPTEPESLRRMAYREGLIPRVHQSVKRGDDNFVRKLFLPNVNQYITEIDAELGGPILSLMIELEEGHRAKPVVDFLADPANAIERRLKAGRILIEAGSQEAVPVYKQILEEAKVKKDGDTLALPEKQIDKRLVRTAMLGMVATGHTAYVRRAKGYLKDASPAEYIEVLQALAKNPAEGAKLALKTAMMDARPSVRNRAIELYSERENVTVDAFLNILRDEDFKRGMTGTRQRIAEVVGEQFPRQWIPQLKRQLTSDEGILPALKLVRHVYRETGETKILKLIRKDLVRIAKTGKAERSPLAAYLLVQLPEALEDEEIVEVIEETVADPLPRYAYIERIVRDDPSEHVDFLLDHFYAPEGAPEGFTIRLLAGAGLWAAEHGAGGSAPAAESDTGSSSS